MYYKPSALMLMVPAVVAALLGVPLVLLLAHVLMCIWSWFDLNAVMPMVHYRSAVGVLLVASLLVGGHADPKDAEEARRVLEESVSRSHYIRSLLFMSLKSNITKLFMVLFAWGAAWLWSFAV